ncbi:MAG: S-layer homology domain-containing protein, partial [Paenibacillaceae bacterium]
MIKGLKLSMKQMLMIILIVCLIMPQAAFAIETGGTVTSPNGKFSDTSNHWANKHISKIALLGFAQGNAGKFLPNDSISQQEAIIMLINMMGKKDQINPNTEAVLPFKVAAWAKPYVVLALGEKLISIKEEQSPTEDDWGTNPASREWITKLIVRAIGQQGQAELANDDDTGFTDADMIGDGYAGYINIAQSLNIVNGLPDGSFNPAGLITRAEMAILLGEAEQHLAERSTMISSGIVLNSDAISIQIQENSGFVKNFSIHPDAGFYSADSNNPIQASSLTTDDYVTIIHDQGIAYYVEISDEQVVMESFIGTMESISKVDLTISLNIDGVSKSFKYADNVEVMDEVKGLSISDLTVGSTLELKRNSVAASTDITQIIVKAAPVYKTVIGTVDNIQTVNHIVEVKETSTGSTVAYAIPETIVITNGTRTLTSLSELYIGDEVTIELKDDVVTSFIVSKSSIIVEEGIVDTVDVVGEKIYFITPDNTIKGYFIAEEAQVLITGLDGAGLEDIQDNDEVLIELNGNNLVTTITVQNRTITTKLGMEFFFYDEDAMIVYLKKDKTSIADAFEISETTILGVGNTSVSIESLGTYFTKGKKVDITYSGNRIMAMMISTKYDGELLSINTTTKTININSDYYGELSLSYAMVPTVEIYGKTSASLSDLT